MHDDRSDRTCISRDFNQTRDLENKVKKKKPYRKFRTFSSFFLPDLPVPAICAGSLLRAPDDPNGTIYRWLPLRLCLTPSSNGAISKTLGRFRVEGAGTRRERYRILLPWAGVY